MNYNHSVDRALAERNLRLPVPAAPVADYVPVVVAGGFAHVSGQLPFLDGAVMTGRLGEERNVEAGRLAAQQCALMVLAQIKAALGSFDLVERLVKLGVFVNCDARFTEHPKVADGASSLMVAVLGEAGRHARAAVGVPALPLGAMVEVDAIFALRAPAEGGLSGR